MRILPKQKRGEQASRQARLEYIQILNHFLHATDHQRKPIVIELVGRVVG